jgi:hypothetical protein
VIRAYYEQLWAADTDAKRAKLRFSQLPGSLKGKAIAIVKNSQGSCRGYSPAIPPTLFGSQMFIYTPISAAEFRKQVLIPFFSSHSSSLNTTAFETSIDQLFDTQLAATLSGLDPAKRCSLISVGITTKGDVPAEDAKKEV